MTVSHSLKDAVLNLTEELAAEELAAEELAAEELAVIHCLITIQVL